MTDTNDTVAVPVELAKRLLAMTHDTGYDDESVELAALIPKQVPRLVAIDLNEAGKRWERQDFLFFDEISAQPDLLALIDGVVDVYVTPESALGMNLKGALRAALRVSA